MRHWIRAATLGVLALGASPLLAAPPGGDNQYFDYHDNNGNPYAVAGSAGSSIPSDFTASPFLTDATAAQVTAYLNAAAAANIPLAVKIPTNYVITPGSAASNVFNQFSVKYVFADYEGPNAVSQTSSSVNMIKTQAGTKSANANIGNYYFATVSNDPSLSPFAVPNTSPSYVTPGNDLENAYRPSGVSMSNPQLYPGQPDFRMGGVPQTNGTTAPARDTAPTGEPIESLRTSLFVGTIMRLSSVAANIPAGSNLIPYVSRFENWQNPALDSDGNSANGYTFANPTGNQMLSRQDFEAQMLAYRMRGATGFMLHEPGVVGYSQAQFQADARKGWEAANNIYGYGTAASPTVKPTPVTLGDLTVLDAQDHQYHSALNEGVIYQGVVNSSPNSLGSTGNMTILVSNLSGSSRYIILPSRIAGGLLNSSDLNPGQTLPAGLSAVDVVAVASGTHRLLEFSRDSNFNWVYAGDNTSAFDSDPTATARDGVGVPEPAAISLLGMAGMGLLIRRPRRIA